MNLERWRERAEKVASKAIWSGLALTARPPRIETVQQRASTDGGSGLEVVRRCLGPSYVEPTWGYIIAGKGVLVEESMLPNFEYARAPWTIGMPSPRSFLAVRRNPARVVEVQTAVSLRHFWEWNFHHFYVDVLSKLALFEEAGIDRETPIVLGPYADELQFAREIIKIGGLGKRNWIIQDHGTYVRAEDLYFCRLKKSYDQRAAYLLEAMDHPGGDPDANERVFLTRPPTATRRLLNSPEIEAILHEYGFTTFDPSGVPVAEQIAVFSRTRYLVALHGAGLANILFRRGAPLSILELHGSDYNSGEFKTVSDDLGYAWDQLGGPYEDAPHQQHANFSIDPEQLREKLLAMLG